MSFFIRKDHNPKNQKKRKFSQVNKSNKKFKKPDSDEEIESDEEIGNDNDIDNDNEFHSDNETPQERQLRLAKIYLNEIKEQEQKRNESKSFMEQQNALTQRLHDDVLEQAGKLKKQIADSVVRHGPDESLKCKFHKLSITCFVLSSDNESIYSGSLDGSLIKWSLKDKCRVLHLKNHTDEMKINKHPAPVLSLAISNDNIYLACGLKNSKIIIFCPKTLNHIHTFKEHKGPVTGLSFRKNSHDLYSCSLDKSVKVWNLTEKAYIETLFGHQFGITSIDALYRERAVTSGGRDSSIRLWKVDVESQLIFNGVTNSSIDVVKLINEDTFVSGDDRGNICLWNSQKKKPICTIKLAHGTNPENKEPYWITSLATLTNTDIVASGSHNGIIQLWKLDGEYRSLSPLIQIATKGFINDLSFTKDGSYLIAAVAKEHKAGRWWSLKEIKNEIKIFPLIKK